MLPLAENDHTSYVILRPINLQKQTDFNDKQGISQTSNPPEKQFVTEVTAPIDTEPHDKSGAAGNTENNSNNIDIISNSYNNISNNLATATPYSNTNTPPYPLDALLPLLRYQITP